MGRPRLWEELPRQSGACGGRPRDEVAGRRAQARRDPSGGYWLAAALPCASTQHQGFGLWIGFHNCSQDDYLDMVRGYVEYYGLRIADEDLRREALAWAITRGSRSGRVASQYILDLAGRLGVPLAQT